MKLRTGIARHRIGMAGVTLFFGSMLLTASERAGAATEPPSLSSSSATKPTLCDAVINLNRLVVRRTDALPQDAFEFSIPALDRVKNVALVKKVAIALCALPKMPGGTQACPADYGITYDLTFSETSRTFPPVGTEARGCQVVHGLGPTRWVADSPKFWRVLGQAMGLQAADQAAFAGHRPEG